MSSKLRDLKRGAEWDLGSEKVIILVAFFWITMVRHCFVICLDRAIRSDEELTLETLAFRISVRWPIYIINSVRIKPIFVHNKIS